MNKEMLRPEQGITIVIPLFNREVLIQETIDSVLQQTSENWELNIIDDGSTDQSFELASQYGETEPRINVWRRQSATKGAPTCRNEGLQKSSYSNVIFLDSDDLLERDCVKNRLADLSERVEADFLVYAVEMFDQHPGDSNDRWCFESTDYLGDFLNVPLWQTAAPVWRKRFLTENELQWDPALGSWQDWDFHVRALATDPVFHVFANSVDCFCRRSQSGRITNLSSQSPKMLNQRADLFEATTLWLQEENLLTRSRMESMARQFIKVAIQFQKISEPEMANNVLDTATACGLISNKLRSPVERYIRFESARRRDASRLERVLRRVRKQWFFFTIPKYVFRRRHGTLRLN